MPLLVKRRSIADFGRSQSERSRAEQRSRPRPSSPSTPVPAGQVSLTLLSPPRLPARPVSEHGSTPFQSRLSHEIHPDDISESNPDSESRRPPKRFSFMKFRNYSESHLPTTANMDERTRESKGSQPPVPSTTADGAVPAIIKTAPTMNLGPPVGARYAEDERYTRPTSLFKRASSRGPPSPQSQARLGRKSMDERRSDKKSGSSLRWRKSKNSGLEDLHRLSTMNMGNSNIGPAPPSYGDESNSALAVPLAQMPDPRFSESSRSDGSNGSSGDGHIYASTTTTTTHTVSTHTTFFKLPRRNKNRNSLFPLPVKIPPPDQVQQQQEEEDQGPATPRASSPANIPGTPETPATERPELPELQRRHTETSPRAIRPQSQSISSPHAPLAKSTLSFAEPGMKLFRPASHRSQNSATSSPLQPPMRLGLRNRASTTSSFGRSSHDVDTPPPLSANGRNSTSTTGRSSFGGFLTLSRFRQGSEPHSPRHGSPGTRSKSNSFVISREALVIPEREEGDTPSKYLERLESAVSKSVIAGILSKSGDPFAAAVLRSYTRRFPFFGEPIDMSLRKFLLEAELPKETQQVDRVIQAFADRYHECNPGIFLNSDTAYVIAFSIMMLHTDAFNKNNKRKMQKQDYIKNTSGQALSDDILACFYDNICYTPFVHYDEDVDINGEKVLPFKPKKSGGMLKSAIPGADVVKKAAGPVDPYNLLVEQKLDALRPAIRDSINLDDPYDYRGSQGELDANYLQRAFTHTGVLQIISARSRPAAYEGQFVNNGAPNPTESQQGIVDLKITKVGTLWRKSTKRKKTRSPWQEWGAVLTGSQLYLFKNSHWAKGLMHQFTHQQKPHQPRTPVIFKPPLSEFKPDALIKTDNAVALVDHTYTRHKHAFTFVRPGGQEEVLLADNDNELNDWLGLINYAAAFRAAGVRIRGMLAGTEEDPRNRTVRRLNSTASRGSMPTANDEATIQNRALSPQLQRQVMAARRQIMVQKINEIEKDITDANRQLENMLRNSRHLLILAPIASRTRDDVIHAAARADAMIKWLRRDIWRLKCHRDILAMDGRLDGVNPSEPETPTQDDAQQLPELDSARKEKPKMLSRLSSSKARSPPQSPRPVQTAGRPSTTSSGDTFKNSDVFRTPLETPVSQGDEMWRLPPLSLDQTTQDQHRPSVASTYLSASPSGTRHGSLTHSSSTSSILQMQRTHSSIQAENPDGRIRTLPPSAITDRDVELLARSTIGPAPEGTAPLGLGAIDASTPSKNSQDGRNKTVRRSLQKTLRDAHHQHNHSSGVHRHRRNKDSDSTVRSAGAADGDAEEATPGLQRDKPRFILHGKQASVVQFGGDWERMKLRREQYESQHSSSNTQGNGDATFSDYERRRSEQHELLRAGMVSPAVYDLDGRHSSIDEGDDDDDDDDGGDDDTASMLSAQSGGFREDAEAAAAFTAMSEANPNPKQSSFGENEATNTDSEFYDSSQWGPDEGDRRQTVIGPSQSFSSHSNRPRNPSTSRQDETGSIRIVDESSSEEEERREGHGPMSPSKRSREKRRTVIGPSSLPLHTGDDDTWNQHQQRRGKGKGPAISVTGTASRISSVSSVSSYSPPSAAGRDEVGVRENVSAVASSIGGDAGNDEQCLGEVEAEQ